MVALDGVSGNQPATASFKQLEKILDIDLGIFHSKHQHGAVGAASSADMLAPLAAVLASTEQYLPPSTSAAWASYCRQQSRLQSTAKASSTICCICPVASQGRHYLKICRRQASCWSKPCIASN
jgi:hypothetical protein